MSENVTVIDDLRERIGRGIEGLHEMCDSADALGDRRSVVRLNGKIQGLELVKDWLRSYDGAGR